MLIINNKVDNLMQPRCLIDIEIINFVVQLFLIIIELTYYNLYTIKIILIISSSKSNTIKNQ